MMTPIPGGNFSVARKIFNSKIWLKPPLFLKTWVFIIGQANHSDSEKAGKVYKRGELITTYDKIIKALAYYHNRKYIPPTLKQVRVILDWLALEGMVRVIPLQIERPTGADPTAHTGAYIGIKIVVINYDTYQRDKNYKGRHQGRGAFELGHNNNNEEKCFKKYSPNSYEVQTSERLFSLIRERYGKFKEPDLQKWAVHIDRMLKIDERDQDEIIQVLEWCQGNEFWQNNILSTEKLREKYGQLYLKMTGAKAKPKESAITPPQQPKISACRRCGAQCPPQDLTETGCYHCDERRIRNLTSKPALTRRLGQHGHLK